MIAGLTSKTVNIAADETKVNWYFTCLDIEKYSYPSDNYILRYNTAYPKDTVPSNWNGTTKCYYNTTCNGTITFSMKFFGNCAQTASLYHFNQMLPIFSYNTTYQAAFQSATVSIRQEYWENAWPDYSSKNQVLSKSRENPIYINPCQVFHLTLRSSSPDLPLCIDNVFMLTNEYLNELLISKFLVRIDSNDAETYQELSQPLYNPFDRQFTQISSICTPYSYAAEGANNIAYQARFTIDTTNVNNTVLLQYVYVQIGEQQQNYQWSLQIMNYTQNLATNNYAWTWVTIGNYSGSQFITMPLYAMAAQIQIKPLVTNPPNTDQQLQICSVQMFGQNYCSKMQFNWPSLCLATDQIYNPLVLNFTVVLVSNQPLIDYCVAVVWFDIALNGQSLDNSTLSSMIYDPITQLYTYNFTFPKNVQVKNVNLLEINAYDPRYSQTINIGNMGAKITTGVCSQAILSSGKISLWDSSWTIKYTQNSGTKTYKYQLSCDCSISQNLTLVVFQLQGGPPVTNDYELFTNCTQSNSSICIYQDSSAQSLHVFGQELANIQDDKNLFLYATVTFASDDCSQQVKKGAPTTQKFTIELTTCSDTTFKDIIVLTKSAGQPSTGIDLAAKLQDVFWPTQAEFQVTDTQSFLMNPKDGFTACGRRTYAIEVDPNDPNSSLASELISSNCSSCLLVTTPGFTAILTVVVPDIKYQNLTLSYILTVGLLNQLNFGPAFQQKFTLKIAPYEISIKKPFFTQALPKVQNLTCGQQLTLPNITSPQNTSISMNFTFGLASSFLTVINNKISVDKNCQPGEYQINIALIDVQYNTQSILSTTLNIAPIKTIENSELQKILDTLLQTENSAQNNLVQTKLTSKSDDKPRIAKIASVDRVAVLTLSFSSNLYVPDFLQNQTTTQSKTNTKSSFKSFALKDYIGTDTLQISLQTQSGNQILDWKCEKFETNKITIQLNFSKPLEISASQPDIVHVKFLQPNRFLVQDKTSYFFTDQQSQVILTHEVPTQQASKSIAQMLQSAGEQSVRVGVASLVLSLIIQVIAKKAISLMWIYFTCIQMNLLIISQANMVFPASVATLMQSISDSINLTALKDLNLLQYIKFTNDSGILGDSQFVQNLSGISICLAAVIFIAIIVLVLKKLFGKYQIGYYIENIKRSIFWNPVIRAFQGSYLNMQFSAYKSFSTRNSTIDIISASGIIFCQYQVVTLLTAVLLFSNETFLKRHKDSISNLFKNLDTTSKPKLFYSTVFFLFRSSVALILACKVSLGIQSALIQLSIVFNLIYLVNFNPYQQLNVQSQDFWSNWFLLVQFLIQLTTSKWNPTGASRYYYGFVYDAVVSLSFVFNWIIILNSLELVFKLKKTYYELKKAHILRQNLKKKSLNEKIKLHKQKLQAQNHEKQPAEDKLPIQNQNLSKPKSSTSNLLNQTLNQQASQNLNQLQLQTISEQNESSIQSRVKNETMRASESSYSEEQVGPQLYDDFVNILKEYDSGTKIPFKTKQSDAYSPRLLNGTHTTYDKKQTYLSMPQGFLVNYDYLPALLRPKPLFLIGNEQKINSELKDFASSDENQEDDLEQEAIEEVKVSQATEQDILQKIRERYGFPTPKR